MQVPTPTAEHRRLERLAGTWSGEETLFPSPWMPEERRAKGRLRARMEVGGLFLVTDYQEAQGGEVTFRGHGVYGWDPELRAYTMHWFDSMGGGGPQGPARGTWHEDTLTFERQGPEGWARYVYVLEAPNRLTFRIESSQDGSHWSTFLEGRYRRRAAPRKRG